MSDRNQASQSIYEYDILTELGIPDLRKEELLKALLEGF